MLRANNEKETFAHQVDLMLAKVVSALIQYWTNIPKRSKKNRYDNDNGKNKQGRSEHVEVHLCPYWAEVQVNELRNKLLNVEQDGLAFTQNWFNVGYLAG